MARPRSVTETAGVFSITALWSSVWARAHPLNRGIGRGKYFARIYAGSVRENVNGEEREMHRKYGGKYPGLEKIGRKLVAGAFDWSLCTKALWHAHVQFKPSLRLFSIGVLNI